MGCVPKFLFLFWERSQISQKVGGGHENDGLESPAFMRAVLQSATLLNEVPQD
jgi:hypothetical protein